MAADDATRHDRQVEELKKWGYYKLKDGSKSIDPQNAALLKVKQKKKKRTGGDDDSMSEAEEPKVVPKKASSAWVFFNTEESKRLRATGVDQKVVFSKSAENWNALNEEGKKPYNKKAAEDKQRCDHQTAAMA